MESLKTGNKGADEMECKRRYQDQDGIWAKTKYFMTNSFVQGVAGVLLTATIIWMAGIFSGFSTTYAQRVELLNLREKQLTDYRDLENRKMNKEDYLREHALLREEMTKGFSSLAVADRDNLDMLIKIYGNQQRYYKKQNEIREAR
jgi:hypothetical protein